MTWVKLDDQFADHPKVVAAGPLASWLYVCSLTYASRLQTDGFIPAAQVRRLADIESPEIEAERLVTVGLWEEVDGGYQIHDYGDYQLTKADREQKRAAGRAGGQASAKARAQAPAEPPATKVLNRSDLRADTELDKDEAECDSSAPVRASSNTKQRRHVVFETLYELWLGTPYEPPGECTDDERGRLNKAAGQLARKPEATAEEIMRRWAEAAARAGPEYPVTPQTLTKSWTDLAHERSQSHTSRHRTTAGDVTRNAVREFVAGNGEPARGDRWNGVDVDQHRPVTRRPERLGEGMLDVPDGRARSDPG